MAMDATLTQLFNHIIEKEMDIVKLEAENEQLRQEITGLREQIVAHEQTKKGRR